MKPSRKQTTPEMKVKKSLWQDFTWECFNLNSFSLSSSDASIAIDLIGLRQPKMQRKTAGKSTRLEMDQNRNGS
jgi:hypothetical protein